MPVNAKAVKSLFSCFAFTIILAAASCTIVKIGDTDLAMSTAAQKAAGTQSFDPKAYAKENWAKIETEILGQPADLRELVAGLREKPEAANEKYGKRKDVTALYNYIVAGKAKVVSVNTESSAGYLEIDIPDISGKEKVKIQIGPVYKTTSIRDALAFVKFGDFINQVDFANVAKEINFYVRDNVVTGLDTANLAGKQISFVGAFTEDSTGTILITPVQIGVQK
ncbi:MAG: DUF2291 domain-containing protein [Bacillota bacterium]|nr:DUF2291 domain-containing protein [Bacillota bacterium]